MYMPALNPPGATVSMRVKPLGGVYVSTALPIATTRTTMSPEARPAGAGMLAVPPPPAAVIPASAPAATKEIAMLTVSFARRSLATVGSVANGFNDHRFGWRRVNRVRDALALAEEQTPPRLSPLRFAD